MRNVSDVRDTAEMKAGADSNWRAGGLPRVRLPLEVDAMSHAFLSDTYQSECLKVVSVWSEFHDDDLPFRPRSGDSRGRSVLEQMVHQSA